ncbi:MAG: ankyrin-3-like [Rickettsiaceae bacterium]|jgi:ankyrin repeat protein|nr:ankyrin-3-like [Rickettsiaceae bacterium]
MKMDNTRIAPRAIDLKLLKAVKNGNYVETIKILSSGANIKSIDTPENPLLVHAIDNPMLLYKLIEAGANPFCKTSNGTPIIFFAIASPKMVNLFLRKVGSPFSIDKKLLETPVTPDINETLDRIDIARELLNKAHELGRAHELVNMKDANGNSAIHLVTEIGDLNLLELLLGRAAYINSPNNFKVTPLHWVTLRGQLEMVEYLVSKGASIDVRDEKGNTPLHLASILGNVKLIEYLSEKGQDINALDNAGFSPLHSAVIYKQEAAIKALIKNGADYKIKCGKGGKYNALEFAERTSLVNKNFIKIAEVLKECISEAEACNHYVNEEKTLPLNCKAEFLNLDTPSIDSQGKCNHISLEDWDF